jgi:hypothetical protein
MTYVMKGERQFQISCGTRRPACFLLLSLWCIRFRMYIRKNYISHNLSRVEWRSLPWA